MPKRILTLKEMDDARDNCAFCYLCGSAIIERSRKAGVQIEHVIPKGLLGPSPDDSAWPVTMWVHPRCDRENKQRQDSLLAAVHNAHLIDPENWNRKAAAKVAKVLRTDLMDQHGAVYPAFDAKDYMMASYSWIRGFHAALYGEFLPLRLDAAKISGPMPQLNVVDSKRSQALTWENFLSETSKFDQWATVQAMIRIGRHVGCLDQVSAWGGQVEYRAIWSKTDRRRSSRGRNYTCVWSLEYPGVYEMSATVYGSFMEGEPRPWHGMYRTPRLPDQASFVDLEEVERKMALGQLSDTYSE